MCALLAIVSCIQDPEVGADDFATKANKPIVVVPLDAADFFVLADGTDLTDFDSEGSLQRRVGSDTPFTSSHQATYEQLKTDARLRWIVRDLGAADRYIAKSDNAHENLYGASVSKALVLAALLWSRDGALDGATWDQGIRLITRSDNSVWTPLEDKAGGANGVQAFVDEMGYENTIGYRRSGNQINALELSDFLYDVHHQRFAGAEGLYKLMSACRTGSTRARKYLPSQVVMGGKTGSWKQWAHDMRFLEIDGRRYAVIVLSEAGDSEKVAVMFGGLVREYLID
jgi:beta-lactamase class A